MSILINEDTRLVVQGITGNEGEFHTGQMIEYGTNVVAGVTPGKGGMKVHDRLVYNTVREAVESEKANTSVIFVPPRFAGDAIMEAADAGIEVIICITEGIPVADMINAYHFVQKKGATLVGPNCPGVLTPGVGKVGIMPSMIFSEGPIGVVSRSGTLTYEAVDQLTKQGLGQTTAEAAEYIKAEMTKQVFAFIAGKTAPPGRRMGHAGAIISGGKGTAEDKFKALKDAGAIVVENPAEMGETVKAHVG